MHLISHKLPLIWTLLLLSLLKRTEAAHSRRRVVSEGRPAAPRYDRSITTFDPSGRLLQIEYGMQAANRGVNVLAALSCDDSLCLIVEQSSAHKVHRIGDHIWLVTAGLTGDARSLASALRSYYQRHRIAFGQVPTTGEIAKYAASLQHQLTRMGGTRPLGCTAMVLGIDEVDGRCSPRLFRTDVGGILEDCLYCAAGRDQARLDKALGEELTEESTNDALQTMLLLLKLVAKVDKDRKVDVWLLKPSKKRRGNTHAICMKDVVCGGSNVSTLLTQIVKRAQSQS